MYKKSLTALLATGVLVSCTDQANNNNPNPNTNNNTSNNTTQSATDTDTTTGSSFQEQVDSTGASNGVFVTDRYSTEATYQWYIAGQLVHEGPILNSALFEDQYSGDQAITLVTIDSTGATEISEAIIHYFEPNTPTDTESDTDSDTATNTISETNTDSDTSTQLNIAPTSVINSSNAAIGIYVAASTDDNPTSELQYEWFIGEVKVGTGISLNANSFNSLFDGFQIITLVTTDSYGESDTSIGVSHLFTSDTTDTLTDTITVSDTDTDSTTETETETNTITDSTTQTDTATQTEINQAPTARFTLTANGLTVNVNASTSTDPEASPLTYEWKFYDASNMLIGMDSGVTTSFDYVSAGNINVTLTVTDEGGLTHSTTMGESIAPVVVVPAGDESYSLNSSTNTYEIYDIHNCGENTVLNNANYIYLDGTNLTVSGWNHATNSQYSPGMYGNGLVELSKTAENYNISTSYNDTLRDCNDASTHSSILIKKYGDWDQQHANGIEYNSNNKPAFNDFENFVMDIYVDSTNSVLPTMEEFKSTFGNLLTEAQYNEMDDGNFHIEVLLNAGGNSNASFMLEVDRSNLDKWLRVKVPVNSLDFWELNTTTWSREARTFSTFQYQMVQKIQVVAETASRKVFRNYVDPNFDANTSPRLFKEEAIKIKLIEFSTTGNGFEDQIVDGNPNEPGITFNPTFTLSQDAMVVTADSTGTTASESFTYSWDFNGEYTSVEANPSYAFSTAGEKTITLTLQSGNESSTPVTQTINVIDTGYADLLNRVATNIVATTCINCHETSKGKPLMFDSANSADVEAGLEAYISTYSAQELIDQPNGNGDNHPPGDQITNTANEQDFADLVNAIEANLNNSGNNGNGTILISEDFEDTNVGALSSEWGTWLSHGQINGPNNSNNQQYALVNNAIVNSGQKALHVKVGQESSPTFIYQAIDKSTNPESIYIRGYMYLTISVGGNIEGEFNEHIHWSALSAHGTQNNDGVTTFFDDNNKDLRYGTWKGNIIGAFQAKNKDASTNIRSTAIVNANEWTCFEYAVVKDATFDKTYGWINDVEAFAATEASHWSNDAETGFFDEVTDYVTFGWRSFGNFGLTDIYFDDIVVSTDRIGCN